MSAVLDIKPAMGGRDAVRQLGDVLTEATAARRYWQTKLDKAMPVLAHALSLPTEARAYWQKLIRSPADELHASRSTVVGEFDQLLTHANMTAEALPALATLAGRVVPDLDRLPDARRELSQFIEMVVTRWKTEDDLHRLIVETIELPEWVTEGPVPAHFRPPQSWWDAVDDDPFQPLPDES